MEHTHVWHIVEFYLTHLVRKQPNSRRARVIYNKLKKLVREDIRFQHEMGLR